MEKSIRQKKVASLIKGELSRLFIELIPDSAFHLTSITRVEMSKDLKTAFVYLSIFGEGTDQKILDILNTRKGFLRKSIASRTKLKYNPMLIFSLDQGLEHRRRIDALIDRINKDDE
jgi:ribosome-binding factor A